MELVQSVFPNTLAWGQQVWNMKKTQKEGEKRRVFIEKSLDFLIEARAYRPPAGSLFPEAVDELPNEPNLHL